METTEILEETLKKGSTLMSNALVEYISQRKLIVADCSVVLAKAQKAIDGSYQTDYKLVERLNSDRIQQSLSNAVILFFETCNKLRDECTGSGQNVGASFGSSSKMLGPSLRIGGGDFHARAEP